MIAVGILANPAAARDVRRLVARASTVTIAERCAMIQRVLIGLAKMGVERVLMMRDHGGIAAGLERAKNHQRRDVPLDWPQLEFLEFLVTGEASDTVQAVTLMRNQGCRVIIVLGGDGTHRLVAHACVDIPLVCISTGTNNVFPEFLDSTVAGMAAGGLAMGKVTRESVCLRNKRLLLNVNGAEEIPALVDICVTSENWIGTRALWRPEDFRELYLAFAEPGAIGLSSIGSLLQPKARDAAEGLQIQMNASSSEGVSVEAPIAPGLIAAVNVQSCQPLLLEKPQLVNVSRGTVAFDGEKEIEFCPEDRVEVTLDSRGPWSVDVPKVMRRLAKSSK